MPPPTRRDPLLPAEGLANAPYSPAASRMNTSIQSSVVRRNEESWVEIASQPSSSSLSSIADEIVITGLRVGSSATGINGGVMPSSAVTASGAQPQRRRRLLQQVEAATTATATATTANRPPTSHPTNHSTAPAASTAGSPSLHSNAHAPHSSAGGGSSSQEEYDETESEEDRLMSSSAENIEMSAAAPRTTPSYSLLQYQATQERLRQRAAARASDGDGDGDDEEGVSGDEDDDDDDDGTALGVAAGGPPTFRPQPNAFSHPPTHLQHHLQQQQQQQQYPSHRSLPSPHSQVVGGPYVPRGSRASRHYSAPNFMSPSYREDNDAALRASLTTLLSCAAAARGLPKKEGNGGSIYAGEQVGSSSAGAANNGVRPSNQPMGLRFVPESELIEDNNDNGNNDNNGGGNSGDTPISPRTRTPFQPPRMPQQARTAQPAPRSSHASAKQQAAPPASTQQHQHQQHQHHSSRNSAVSAVSTSSKSKRTGASKSSPRVTKKKRTSVATDENGVTMISPTLLTWVVSAGVVVLVSVVGFGAGFVIGREVGRQEAASSVSAAAGAASSGMAPPPAGNGSASVSCGREIMRSSTGSTLRRFRWGAGMANSVAA
ncbi:hypothetical protein SCUCBS95973_002578 [Sporothrix curviconia]|uniref:Uncharacterized protein n=1 Tax=Sporothrix curviconia TaxID=1260050 RepID=A0ABP0B823_9PEZI